MARCFGLLGVAAALAMASGMARAQPPGPARLAVVDLTHAFDGDTLYWPTAPSGFELRPLSRGVTPGGWFYAAEAFAAPEHGGTHLDAPFHFLERGRSVDAIAVERLVAPAVVIDVAERAAGVPEYALRSEDVRDFETRHGRISPGSVALLRTGWDRFWPDRERYLGDATPGDASKLRFPSFGAEAARLLAARGVAGVGVDTASIDVGSSRDFPVHRALAAADVYGLENLRGLDALPPTGATLIALPMKIAAGSGAPVRAIALLPEPRP